MKRSWQFLSASNGILRGVILLAFVTALMANAQPAHAFPSAVCRVDPLAPGPTHDGSSWTFAYRVLPTALALCAQVWVKAGVYVPGASQTDTFTILPGQEVYGGFNGTESVLGARDPSLNVTILSGDIDGNDANLLTTNIDATPADIKGANSHTVVTLDGSAGTPITVTTILEGFTITGGDGDSAFSGGGLYCNGGGAGSECSPALNNLTFSGNQAYSGGAVYLNGGSTGESSPVFTNVVFTGNHSAQSGGAVYGNAFGGLSNPAFNTAVFNANSAVFNGGAVFENAESGGGANHSYTNVTFNANTAGLSGGAVFNDGDGGSSNPTFMFVTFSGNTAGSGGGAVWDEGHAGSASPNFTNVTFNGNGIPSVPGSAIYSEAPGSGASSPFMTNVTISGNVAGGLGGALYNYSSGSGASNAYLTNVILWNDIGGEITNGGTATTTLSYSILPGICPAIPGVVCGANVFPFDPMLGPLAHNGGVTNTMALIAGSAAIDQGSGCAAVDQRIISRPQGPACDIGAFEYDRIFADVPVTGKEWMERWIDAFYAHGITTGCGSGPLIYCPESNVTRAEMAVFLLRAKHGPGYVPPSVYGIFSDMPVVGKEWMEPWVDEFYVEGITTGCGTSPLRFCPENHVTRAEMAVFILRATHIPLYAPPLTSGIFSDMPVTGKEWMESWVDEFYNEGITTGCASGPLRYCPESNVTRAEMAVFIDRAYSFYP